MYHAEPYGEANRSSDVRGIFYLLLLIWLLFSVGCAVLTGRVSTAVYSESPKTASFTVVGRGGHNLTDRQIGNLLSQAMVSRGYMEAADRSSADLALIYSYSVGTGHTVVSSSPDFVFGGQEVTSSTKYPRVFEVALVDLKASRLPDDDKILWQGEVYSTGRCSDMAVLAPIFIHAIFKNFGRSVKQDSFADVLLGC